MDSGKPMVDAAFGEIMVTCEKIWWLVQQGERYLRPESRSAGTMVGCWVGALLGWWQYGWRGPAGVAAGCQGGLAIGRRVRLRGVSGRQAGRERCGAIAGQACR